MLSAGDICGFVGIQNVSIGYQSEPQSLNMLFMLQLAPISLSLLVIEISKNCLLPARQVNLEIYLSIKKVLVQVIDEAKL